ncbi:hypothetical protein AB0M46_29880 [Dactylosporangium sp. NPDC051485]|uniref:hypothetical protein n=1 Tax=Dactylosporangium sp. NPDC051485 TaxID=3154846 RepID=UPI00341DC2C1
MNQRGALIGCLVFVAASTGLLLADGDLSDKIAGGMGIAFFGPGAVLIAADMRGKLRKPPPAEERRDDWFPSEDDEFTEFEAAMVQGLREGARHLPAGGARSEVFRNDEDGSVVAMVSLRDQAELLCVGLHLLNGRLRGDELDSHTNLPSAEPTPLAMPEPPVHDEIGSPLAWLESLLRRPVELLVWRHNGIPYAARYQFTDTTEGLVEAFAEDWAPPGLFDRLRREGGTRGKGLSWVRTAALPAPDVVLPVRVDGSAYETRRLPNFLWYQCPFERRRPAWRG